MKTKARDVAELLILIELRRLTVEYLRDLASRNPDISEAVRGLECSWNLNFKQIEELVTSAHTEQSKALQ